MKFFLSFCLLATSFWINAQDHDKIELAHQYYHKGEKEKARLLYEQLANSKPNLPLISSNYLSILEKDNDFKEAESFLNKTIKTYPGNTKFRADLLALFSLQQKESKVKSNTEQLFQALSKPMLLPYRVSQNSFFQKGENELAILFWNHAREVLGIPPCILSGTCRGVPEAGRKSEDDRGVPHLHVLQQQYQTLFANSSRAS